MNELDPLSSFHTSTPPVHTHPSWDVHPSLTHIYVLLISLWNTEQISGEVAEYGKSPSEG